MPNPTNRLPVFSSSGPDIIFKLSAEQFAELAAKLKVREIPDAARDDLCAICHTYLTFRRAELGADPQSEALDIWYGSPKRAGGRKGDGVRDAVNRMIALGEGAYPPFGDAGQLVEEVFFESLMRGGLIQLTKADIEPPGIDPFLSAGHEPIEGSALKLSRDFMMRLAGLLRVAVSRADSELEKLGDGFRPGAAFEDWLNHLREWAGANGMPRSAGGENASRFACFLYALHGMLPLELREKQMASADSMNKRLQRHIKSGRTNPLHNR